MDQEKRHYRQLKRDVKRAGTRKMRRHLQRELADNPEEAAHSEFDYGRNRSADLNGNDRDATRRRHAREEKEEEE
jgi:hypothetical protein